MCACNGSISKMAGGSDGGCWSGGSTVDAAWPIREADYVLPSISQ